MSNAYVFGYGSLMNKESLQTTLPGKQITSWATLRGYRRAFNKAGRRGHRYLNISADPGFSVKGALIEVTEEELEALKKREDGYNMIDVTEGIEPAPAAESVVYSFSAPPFAALKVSRSYLNTVLAALPAQEREQWLRETDFEGAEIDEEG